MRNLRIVLIVLPLMVINTSLTVMYQRVNSWDSVSKAYSEGYKEAVLDCIKDR